MPALQIQVTVDQHLKQQLEALAKADGRSVSGYVRNIINHHLLSLQQPRRTQAIQPLDDFLSNL